MKNLANFVLFQVFWFVAVQGGANGRIWLGPLAVLAFLAMHLAMVEKTERAFELRYVAAVGVLGAVLDSALHALDVTSYPGSDEAWPHVVAPPWIVSLWVAFACLPRFSLGWLRSWPKLAVLFGALGGPLSYFAGTRLAATGVPESSLWTYGGLAIEYAVVTPLLLRFAGPESRGRSDVAGSLEPSSR